MTMKLRIENCDLGRTAIIEGEDINPRSGVRTPAFSAVLEPGRTSEVYVQAGRFIIIITEDPNASIPRPKADAPAGDTK